MVSKRLFGVDCVRLIAAFGVVAIHAAVVWDGRKLPATLPVSSFFSFVVPFFVVVSLAMSLKGSPLPWMGWASKYFKRLIVPYIVWAAVYCVLRWVRYRHDPAAIFSDPIALLFNGGGSLALYFIPMLVTGLIFARLLHSVLVCLRTQQFALVACWAIASLLLAILLATGNGYDLTASKGFMAIVPEQQNALLRILLVLIAHVLFCIPHVFLALLGWHLLETKKIRVLLVLGASLFILPSFGDMSVGIFEHLRGDGAFLFALGVSPYLARRWAGYGMHIEGLATCTFGVYLSHQLVLQGLQIFSRKLVPATYYMGPVLMLAQTVLVFTLLCVVIHALSNRSTFFARLFAVR